MIRQAIAAAVALCSIAGSAGAKDAAYQKYRHEVDRATSHVYRANRGVIDPHGLRGRGYDLDHKVSVKSCYQRGMSVASCSSVGNLQMLSSHENRSLGCKVAGCRRP